MLTKQHRHQLKTIFPSLAEGPDIGLGPTALSCLTLQETERLANLLLEWELPQSRSSHAMKSKTCMSTKAW